MGCESMSGEGDNEPVCARHGVSPNYAYTEEEIKWALDSIIETGVIPTATIVLKFLRKTIQEERI